MVLLRPAGVQAARCAAFDTGGVSLCGAGAAFVLRASWCPGWAGAGPAYSGAGAAADRWRVLLADLLRVRRPASGVWCFRSLRIKADLTQAGPVLLAWTVGASAAAAGPPGLRLISDADFAGARRSWWARFLGALLPFCIFSGPHLTPL